MELAGLQCALLYAWPSFIVLWGKGGEILFLLLRLPFTMFLIQTELLPILSTVNPILAFLLAGMAFVIAALWRKLSKKEEQERQTVTKVTELLISVSKGMDEDKRLREDLQMFFLENKHNWLTMADLRKKVESILENLSRK